MRSTSPRPRRSYTQTVDRVVDACAGSSGARHRCEQRIFRPQAGGLVSESPVDPADLNQAWDRAYEILTDSGSLSGAQAGFIRLTKPLGVIDDTILLAVPSEFAKDFIETRARESIISALSTALSRTVRVAVTVDPTLDATPEPANQSVRRCPPLCPAPCGWPSPSIRRWRTPQSRRPTPRRNLQPSPCWKPPPARPPSSDPPKRRSNALPSRPLCRWTTTPPAWTRMRA